MLFLSDLGAALEPCGCTSDQRGGLAHADAFADGAPVAVGAAGPTFFDELQVEPGPGSQAVDKAYAVARILGQHAFFIAPSRNEFAAGREELEGLLAAAHALPVSSSVLVEERPHGRPRLVSLGPTKVGVVGYSGAPRDEFIPPVDGVSLARNQVSLEHEVDALRREGARFIVLLASAGRGEVLRVVERTPGLNLVVVGDAAVRGEVVRDDLPVDRLGTTVVVHPASRFQSLAVVELDDRGGEFHERSAAEGGDAGSSFRVRIEPVVSTLARGKASDAILAEYNERVDAQNRVRYADRRPQAPAAGHASYVGVDVCAACHGSAAAFWKSTGHARAYPTLTDRHRAFDLDCVGCHVTGYEKPGGSTVTHVAKLENVQCEVCHGPGSLHVARGGDPGAIVRRPEASVCAGCHHEPHVPRGWRVEDHRPRILGPGHGGVKQGP